MGRGHNLLERPTPSKRCPVFPFYIARSIVHKNESRRRWFDYSSNNSRSLLVTQKARSTLRLLQHFVKQIRIPSKPRMDISLSGGNPILRKPAERTLEKVDKSFPINSLQRSVERFSSGLVEGRDPSIDIEQVRQDRQEEIS